MPDLRRSLRIETVARLSERVFAVFLIEEEKRHLLSQVDDLRKIYRVPGEEAVPAVLLKNVRRNGSVRHEWRWQNCTVRKIHPYHGIRILPAE